MAKQQFGGPWTLVKLSVLEKYLLAYANVFKNLKYKLIYVDAFAGTGRCDTKVGNVDGSAKIALAIDRFDEYIFIESDQEKFNELLELKKQYPQKNITIINGDCNLELNKIVKKYDWKYCRALAFIDPFSFEFDFNTHSKIANTKAFDIWYLFPISYATRYMPIKGGISESNKKILDKLFGELNWENTLYKNDPQLNFFNSIDGSTALKRVKEEVICCYFKNRLHTLYPSVLCPLCLRNSNNAPLFLLYFAISNPDEKAIKLGNKIAKYLIGKKNQHICKK